MYLSTYLRTCECHIAGVRERRDDESRPVAEVLVAVAEVRVGLPGVHVVFLLVPVVSGKAGRW